MRNNPDYRHLNPNRMKKKIIISILTIVSSTLLFTSCDSGSDDGSAGNCFFGLLLLLCWLKGGRK